MSFVRKMSLISIIIINSEIQNFQEILYQVLSFVNLTQNWFVDMKVFLQDVCIKVKIQILLPILFTCPGSNHWFQSFQGHFDGHNSILCTINKLLWNIGNFFWLIIHGLELYAAVISIGDVNIQVKHDQVEQVVLSTLLGLLSNDGLPYQPQSLKAIGSIQHKKTFASIQLRHCLQLYIVCIHNKQWELVFGEFGPIIEDKRLSSLSLARTSSLLEWSSWCFYIERGIDFTFVILFDQKDMGVPIIF